MTLRLIDLMCTRHRTQILKTRIWPHHYMPGNHTPGNNSCDTCAAVGITQPSGTTTMLPGVDSTTSAAIHEAGHVVAGMAAGIAVTFADMSSSGRPGSTAHYQAIGLEYQVGSTGHAVMALAGSVTSRRWLRSHGYATDADMVDAVATGLTDLEELFELGWTADRLASMVADTDAVIDLHWNAIGRVADQLLSRGRLSGIEIADAARIQVAS